MKTGTVIGRIVASKRLPELPPGALLEVQLDYPKDVVVCYDPLGCGIGERVMITIGAPACGGRRAHHCLTRQLRHPHTDALTQRHLFPSPLPSTSFLNPFFFKPSRRLTCHKPSE